MILNHSNTVIHERDGQTDGRTLHDSKDRYYASHRAVKNRHFYVPQPPFFCPGDTLAAITQNVAGMKRQFTACQTPRNMYPSIQQFRSYSNCKCKKSPFSRTAAHIFVSPGNAPATITQYVAWMERQFNACQTPRSMYLSIFNSFRVIRCLSKCVSPKIAILSHFSPGNAPGEITLNVLWMERESYAYKLSRNMYPSIFNSFPLIRTASAKNRRFHVLQPTFLFPLDTPLRL